MIDERIVMEDGCDSSLFNNVNYLLRTIDDYGNTRPIKSNECTPSSQNVSFIFSGLEPNKSNISYPTEISNCDTKLDSYYTHDQSLLLSKQYEISPSPHFGPYFNCSTDTNFTDTDNIPLTWSSDQIYSLTSDSSLLDEDKRHHYSVNKRTNIDDHDNLTTTIHQDQNNYYPNNKSRSRPYFNRKNKPFVSAKRTDLTTYKNPYNNIKSNETNYSFDDKRRNTCRKPELKRHSHNLSAVGEWGQTSNKKCAPNSCETLASSLTAYSNNDSCHHKLEIVAHPVGEDTTAQVNGEIVRPDEAFLLAGDHSSSFSKYSEHFSNPDMVSTMIDSYFNALRNIDSTKFPTV